ncbi:MAG TPA: hypothetical protein VF165_18360 [Nocardioidaceae bacterium]
MRRSHFSLVAGAASVALAAGGSTAAAAAVVTPSDRALTVVAKKPDVRIVDLAPKGPSHGDIRAYNFALYSATQSRQIGRLDGYCVLTDPIGPRGQVVVECLNTFSLPGGEITTQSLLPLWGPPSTGENASSSGDVVRLWCSEPVTQSDVGA